MQSTRRIGRFGAVGPTARVTPDLGRDQVSNDQPESWLATDTGFEPVTSPVTGVRASAALVGRDLESPPSCDPLALPGPAPERMPALAPPGITELYHHPPPGAGRRCGLKQLWHSSARISDLLPKRMSIGAL